MNDFFSELDDNSSEGPQREILRWYQEECLAGINRCLETNRSTICVLATGLGKTSCIAEYIRRHCKRALVMCHTRPICQQNCERFEQFGINSAYEMAEARIDLNHHSWDDVQAVSSSIQTQLRRIGKFDPMDFDSVIVDECHYIASPRYRKVIAHYMKNPDCKLIGFTATPNRTDKQALSEFFESVAYDMGILDGINDGWLVYPKQSFVSVSEMDFSHCTKSGDDFNAIELNRIMEDKRVEIKIGAGIVKHTAELRTVIFTASVEQAKMLTAILNEHKRGSAHWVSAETPECDRKQLFKDFDNGRFQYLTNCSVLVEGWNSPKVQCVVNAKPTRSETRYKQMIGRGLRPYRSSNEPTPDDRKNEIATSLKPDLLVLDFTGVVGRFKLINTGDILGGEFSEEARQLAIEEVTQSEKPVDMQDALKKAQARVDEKKLKEAEERRKIDELKRQRHALRADVHTTLHEIDPFDLDDKFSYAISNPQWYGGPWSAGCKLADKTWLMDIMRDKLGLDPNKMSVKQCWDMYGKYKSKRSAQPHTPKQAYKMRSLGLNPSDYPTLMQAREAISVALGENDEY